MLPPRQPKKQKRESRWRSPAHLAWIRGFQCSMPECDGMPIEAAHVRLGSGTGMGQKPDDWRAIPLCRNCHSSQHSGGEETFWVRYAALTEHSVNDLIDALCKASPKAAEIRKERQERDG